MEKLVNWVIDTLKWIATAILVTTITIAAFIFLPPAQAETKYVVEDGIIAKITNNQVQRAIWLEEGVEARTVMVRGFILDKSQALFTDEDSFIWMFKLGEFSLTAGQEYTLLLTDIPMIKEFPEAEYVPLW